MNPRTDQGNSTFPHFTDEEMDTCSGSTLSTRLESESKFALLLYTNTMFHAEKGQSYSQSLKS